VQPRAIVVLVTGDPVPEARQRRGDFPDLIRQTAPVFAERVWQAHDAREPAPLPDLDAALGVIVTGSPFSIIDGLPWMERTAEVLRRAVARHVPVLGICFGHQLLAHALGGRVAKNPRGREIGTVRLTVTAGDPLVGAPRAFDVNSTHVDAVVELPSGARVLAETERDPHSVVRFAPSAWGVQFHPEIDGDVMRMYVEARSEALVREGFDLNVLRRGARDAPDAARLVARFLALASETDGERTSLDESV
jgi:GMP synthase (glutamine-hydrolysing)